MRMYFLFVNCMDSDFWGYFLLLYQIHVQTNIYQVREWLPVIPSCASHVWWRYFASCTVKEKDCANTSLWSSSIRRTVESILFLIIFTLIIVRTEEWPCRILYSRRLLLLILRRLTRWHPDAHFYPKAKSSVSIAETTPSDILLDEKPFRPAYHRRRSAMTLWMNNLSRRIGRRKSIYRRL